MIIFTPPSSYVANHLKQNNKIFPQREKWFDEKRNTSWENKEQHEGIDQELTGKPSEYLSVNHDHKPS